MSNVIQAGQGANHTALDQVSDGSTQGLQLSASQTTQEGQAAVEARLAGHAIAQMGKALDALDKAII